MKKLNLFSARKLHIFRYLHVDMNIFQQMTSVIYYVRYVQEAHVFCLSSSL